MDYDYENDNENQSDYDQLDELDQYDIFNSNKLNKYKDEEENDLYNNEITKDTYETKKYEFRYDYVYNGVYCMSKKELLDIYDIIRKLKYKPHYHEQIKGYAVVPYFDFDYTLDNPDLIKDIVRLNKLGEAFTISIYEAIEQLINEKYQRQKLFKLYPAVSHGYKKNDKGETKYKLSCHVLIRGVGCYKEGKDINNVYIEELEPLFIKSIKSLEEYENMGFTCDDEIRKIIDTGIYKVGESCQFMRVIGSYKSTDENKRILTPVEIDENGFSYKKLYINKITPELFEKYLITNITGEGNPIDTSNIRKYNRRLEITKPNKKNSNNDYNTSTTEIIDDNYENNSNVKTKYTYGDKDNFIEDKGQDEEEIIDLLIELYENIHPSSTHIKTRSSKSRTYISGYNSHKDECLLCNTCHSSNGSYIVFHEEQRYAVYKCHSSREDGEHTGIIVYGTKFDPNQKTLTFDQDGKIIKPTKKDKLREIIQGLNNKENTNLTTLTTINNVKSITYEKSSIEDLTKDKQGIVIIKAEKGVGKTNAVINYMNKLDNLDNKKIGYISFRQTLTNNIKQRFNTSLQDYSFNTSLQDYSFNTNRQPDNCFISYKDVNEETIKADKWICQLESIHRVELKKLDLLIIDEINQVLNQFFSSTMERKLHENWPHFQALIKAADKIIIMDADINEDTIKTIQQMKPDTEIKLHINTFKRNYNMEVTTDEINIRNEIFKAVKSNNKIVIASNSSHIKLVELQKEINKLDITYMDKETGLYRNRKPNTILYTRETMKNKQTAETLTDVNNSWINYDVVIYSPTIQSGLSFEQQHFDYCYGIFNNKTNSYNDCSQMLHRVRQVNKYYVCINQLYTGYLSTTEKDIEEQLKISRYNLIYNKPSIIPYNKKLNKNNEIEYEYPFKNDFYYLYIRYLKSKNISQINFMKLLIEREFEAGAVISIMNDELTNNEITKLKLKQKNNTLEIQNEINKLIADSDNDITGLPVISFTDEDKQKDELKNYYGYTNKINAEFVNLYNNDETKTIYKNLNEIHNLKLKGIKKREQEKYNSYIKDKNEFEILSEAVYDKHRIAELILKTTNMNLFDENKNINVDQFNDVIISKIAGIIKPELKYICSLFKKRIPNLKSWCDSENVKRAAICLKWVNPILNELYGCKVKAVKGKAKKTLGYNIEHNYFNKLFILDKTSNTIVINTNNKNILVN